MRDGPSLRIRCLTPLASSFSSPTAASARGVRSTSSDAAPSPSANVDRRLMLAMIGLLPSCPRDPGTGGDLSPEKEASFPLLRAVALQACSLRYISFLYTDYCNTLVSK